jgi:acetyl esterase/lipase
MQTFLLVLIVFLTANLFLLIGIKVYSYSVYGRSAMATIAEVFLKTQPDKKGLNDEKKINDYLQERRIENAKKFIPPKVKLKSKMAKTSFLGCDVYTFVNTTSPKATLIYLHGGGFIRRPCRYHFAICDKLSTTLNVKVVMPLYPLAPEFNVKHAFYLLNRLYDLYIGQKVILAGDSAGGGLALAFTEYLLQSQKVLPQKLILFSPWVDLSMDNLDAKKYEKIDPSLSVVGLKVVGKAWAGDTFVKDYTVSPLYGNVKGLCPVFLTTGERELFLPDITRLKNRLQNEKVPLRFYVGKGLNHAYPLYPIVEAKQTLLDVQKFLQDV